MEPALIGAALRLDLAAVMRDGDVLGRLLDGFVAAQLRAEASVARTQPRLYHLRQEQGRREIDLLAELAGRRILAIEVKATAAPRVDDARHLAWLRERLGAQFAVGVLLHTGPRAYRLSERLVAAPIASLWS